jgi:hypothetical protein
MLIHQPPAAITAANVTHSLIISLLKPLHFQQPPGVLPLMQNQPLTHHTAGGETYGKAQLQQFADQQTIHRLSTSGTTHQLISLWRCLNNCKHSAVQQSEVAAVVSRLLCHQVGTSKVPIHTLPQYHSDIRQVQHARSCKSYSGNRLLLIQSGREPHSFLQTTPVYCASNTTLFYI